MEWNRKMIEWIKNKLKSDYFKVYFFDMIAKVFTVVISIMIIRCLTEKDYANYTLFNSIGSFISGVLGSGIGLAYTRYAVILRQKKVGTDALLFYRLRNKMMRIVYVIFLMGFIIYFVSTSLTYTFLLGGIYGLILALYQLNVVFFQAREKYFIGGIVSNIKNIVVAIVIFFIFMIPNKTNVYLVLLIYVLAIAVSWLFTNKYINKLIKMDLYNNEKSDLYLIGMFKESIWIILYMFMLSAFNQLDVLILNYTRSVTDVANYGVAYKYYATILSLLPALQVVLRVKNSSVEMAMQPELRRQSVIKWVKKSTPFAVVLFVLGCIGAQIAFPILNGASYNRAILTFDILLVGACLSYITAPNVSVMLAADKQKLLFFLSVGSFFINFIGNIIFIPLYGANAAAVTTVLAHFFLNGGSTLILLMCDKNKDVKL